MAFDFAYSAVPFMNCPKAEQEFDLLIKSILEVKAELDRCMQLQLFAVFMIVVALYDIALAVRRFVSNRDRGRRWID